LPADKRVEVADFARFLAARQDDEHWETLLTYPHRRSQARRFSARECR
jgi:hypothetical protein